jgi:hypothetical protein
MPSVASLCCMPSGFLMISSETRATGLRGKASRSLHLNSVVEQSLDQSPKPGDFAARFFVLRLQSICSKNTGDFAGRFHPRVLTCSDSRLTPIWHCGWQIPRRGQSTPPYSSTAHAPANTDAANRHSLGTSRQMIITFPHRGESVWRVA